MLIGSISALSLLISTLLCGVTGAFETAGWLWRLPVYGLGCFLVLGLLYFLLLWFLCAIVRLDKPQEKDSRLYRTLTVLTAQAALTVLRMRVHTRGLEKTPKSGRFLLVCNHLDNLDGDADVVFPEKPAGLYFQEGEQLYVSGGKADAQDSVPAGQPGE